MFGIGKKDSDGRQTRIEHRGKHVRASRTGGVSLRGQAKAAGMTFTVNSKHGTRVSRRIARGTNIALQGGRFRLRGRYGTGPTKLNLSKSGASVSTKNRLGSFNWTNPNRSSAKVAGVQFRGKRAAQMQTAYLIVTGIISLIQFVFIALFQLLRLLIVVLDFLGRLLVEAAIRAWSLVRSGVRRIGDRRARRRRDHRLADLNTDSAPPLPHADLLAFAVLLLGGGAGNDEPGERERALIMEMLDDADTRAADDPERVAAMLHAYNPETAMAALADRYAKRAAEREILDTFFRLDDLCSRAGDRTRLQDELLDIYCERTGVALEPAAEE